MDDFALLDDALAQLAQVLKLPVPDAVQGEPEISSADPAQVPGRKGKQSPQPAGPKHWARGSGPHGALASNSLRRSPGRAATRHRAR